jgi:pimeloyl-ACP methyl ester carboxylesterase
MTPSLAWLIAKTRILGLVGQKRDGVAMFFRAALGSTNGIAAFDALDEAQRKALLANADAFFAELKAGTGEELTAERLRSIRCPITNFVGGRSAPFFTAAANRLKATLPKMTVVRVADANHLMVVEKPTEFVALVNQAIA